MSTVPESKIPVRSETIPTPPISELGRDLLLVTPFQLYLGLCLPFVCAGLYICAALNALWSIAVLALMMLSFLTYGSTSHDLVHRNLGLPRRMNEFFLFTIELLALRSRHAYRASHLFHYRRYPGEDDIEGASSRMNLCQTLFDGLTIHYRLYSWALKNAIGGKLKSTPAKCVTQPGNSPRHYDENHRRQDDAILIRAG